MALDSLDRRATEDRSRGPRFENQPASPGDGIESDHAESALSEGNCADDNKEVTLNFHRKIKLRIPL